MIHLLLAMIYLAFISLGLPDALLGSAWPIIYQEWSVPVSWAGAISLIISAGTVVSSLMSDRLTRLLGPGKVTACSVAATALALWGFSVSGSFWQLCLWAIPYGLGAGSVDAALNNYVALHYASRHMSWLHCMWGLGASIGPHIMARVLSAGQSWSEGYRVVALIQILLTAALFCSLPLWKGEHHTVQQRSKGLSLRQVLAIPGSGTAMAVFFCYCALECTAALWAPSYLTLCGGWSEADAARYGGLFYIGITVGRALSGFVTIHLNDRQMVRLGQVVALAGLLAVPLGGKVALVGLLLIGFGCAPIYPCLIHATPARFGVERSQALLGVQMASAYVGTSLMPPVFGMLAQWISPALYPAYLLALLVTMAVLHEWLLRKLKR